MTPVIWIHCIHIIVWIINDILLSVYQLLVTYVYIKLWSKTVIIYKIENVKNKRDCASGKVSLAMRSPKSNRKKGIKRSIGMDDLFDLISPERAFVSLSHALLSIHLWANEWTISGIESQGTNLYTSNILLWSPNYCCLTPSSWSLLREIWYI